MPRRALPTLLAALLLAGCGGDGRDEALEVAQRWFGALYAKDAAAACRDMAPTAVAAIRLRYTSVGPNAPCPVVVERYIDDLPNATMRAIRKEGLEVEGAVENDELGVFPVAKKHELDVILMRRDADGRWRVASTRIGSDAAARPAPTADE